MGLFDRLTNPEKPESYGPEPGYFPGCIIGIVVNDVDPKGRGWVQVIAPALSPTQVLPSGEDDFIPVTEEYTVNSAPGGSHRRVGLGTQVLVFPLYPADGKNWIVGPCLSSSVDPPHPELDRSKGLTGSVTREQIFDVTDNATQSRMQAYPHGVTDLISGKGKTRGDRTLQSAEGATVSLKRDGTTTMENPKASAQVTANGQVVQHSLGGATSVLDEKGRATVTSGFGTTMDLDSAKSQITGPLSQISGMMKGLQSSLGQVGQIQSLLQQATQITSSLGLPGATDLSGLLEQSNQLLQPLAGLGEKLGQGAELLDQMQDLSDLDFGAMLTPQLEVFDQLEGSLPQLKDLVKQGGSGVQLLELAQQLLPKKLADSLGKLSAKGLPDLLDQLSYRPDLQLEALLDEATSGKFEQMQNIFGLGLDGGLDQIRDSLTSPLPLDPSEFDPFSYTPEQSQQFQQQIADAIQLRVGQIKESLPQPLRAIIPDENLEFLVSGKINAPTQRLLGQLQKGLVSQMSDKLSRSIPTAAAVKPLLGMLDSFKQGDLESLSGGLSDLAQVPGLESLGALDIQDPSSLFKNVFGALSGQMGPQMEQLTESLNGLSDSIPTSVAGSVMSLTPMMGQLVAGSTVTLTPVMGELTDATRSSSVFATSGTVGVKGAGGGLSFGALGGALSTSGLFSMLSETAGFFLERGGLSIAGGVSVTRDDEGNITGRSEGPAIRVGASSLSLLSENRAHAIVVRPDDIYLDSVSLAALMQRLDSFDSRIDSLSQPPQPPAAPP